MVRRVDNGLGLLCELPAEGQGALPLAPGYAHISNLADSKVEDLGQVRGGERRWVRFGWCQQPGRRLCRLQAGCLWCLGNTAHRRDGCGRRMAFMRCYQRLHLPPTAHWCRPHPPNPNTPYPQYRPGQRVRARVLGFRPMDGLAVLSTKPSVVDQAVASVAGEGGLGCGALAARVDRSSNAVCVVGRAAASMAGEWLGVDAALAAAYRRGSRRASLSLMCELKAACTEPGACRPSTET